MTSTRRATATLGAIATSLGRTAGLVAVVVALSVSGALALSPERCETLRRDATTPASAVRLAEVWSGVGTEPGSAARADGTVFIAYYDPERRVTVARFEPMGRRICRVTLPSVFGGWDAHNSLALALAPDGTLHLAGNMHATPLFYARGKADDLATLTVTTMVGRDEARATYPRFLRDAAGQLLFLYRSGGSGDGVWLINRWRNGTWSRVGTVFSSRDGTRPVSAYPTPLVPAADGWIHVAIVWRRTPDVATNYAVTYARTRDLETWYGLDETPIALPLSPRNTSLVEATGEGAGLVNGARVTLGPDGVPVVFYPRYAATGENAIAAARPAGGRWLVKEIAVAAQRAEVQGRGAMPGLPSVAVVGQDAAALHVRVSFPPQDRRRLAVNVATLEATPAGAPQEQPAAPSALGQTPPGMADVARRRTTVTLAGTSQTVVGSLEWFAQGANFDRPRACTPQLPVACSPPPSPLYWHGARAAR